MVEANLHLAAHRLSVAAGDRAATPDRIKGRQAFSDIHSVPKGVSAVTRLEDSIIEAERFRTTHTIASMLALLLLITA